MTAMDVRYDKDATKETSCIDIYANRHPLEVVSEFQKFVEVAEGSRFLLREYIGFTRDLKSYMLHPVEEGQLCFDIVFDPSITTRNTQVKVYATTDTEYDKLLRMFSEAHKYTVSGR